MFLLVCLFLAYWAFKADAFGWGLALVCTFIVLQLSKWGIL